MHFWVSFSFEKWHVFTKSHHWRLLVSIVSQSKTGNFFLHINQVGVFGLLATAGATILVCLGWIIPIFIQAFTSYHDGGYYRFMALHGVFMVLIIVPWSAACICSSVLFHMVVLAHQSDVEHYFQTVRLEHREKGRHTEHQPRVARSELASHPLVWLLCCVLLLSR